jgi:hypothetical protein
MSETESGDRNSCLVCGDPLPDNLQGWRHLLFCSLECEQLAARWQINEISAAAGHWRPVRPAGAGGSAAPGAKAQPRHAGGKASPKSKSR